MNENLNCMEIAVLEAIKEEYQKEFSTYFLIPMSIYSISELDETKANNVLRALFIRKYISFENIDKQLSLKNKYLTLTEKALNLFNSEDK